MHTAAPRLTRVTSSTTAQRIGNEGDNLIIYGILVEGDGGAGLVTFLNEAEATLFTMRAVSGDTVHLAAPFFADAGLKVTTEATTIVTVFHSQPGR